MLPFNKRPARDSRDGDTPEAEAQRPGRSVPPPARSQPRFDEPPAPARAFQPSLSDDEVTTFMASPAKKKSPKAMLAESGETKARKHIRPPAPSIVDEDEEDGRTQIRPMPKGGKLSLPTSSVSIANVKPKEEPAPAAPRKDLRVPEISLPKSSAVVSEMPDFDAAADAPDFTMQLGPQHGAPPAPSVAKSQPPPALPGQMSTHQFAPVTSAPLRSQPPPPMSAPAVGNAPPAPLSAPMVMQPNGAPINPMMSGQVPAAPMSGMPMQPMMGAGMSGGFPQQGVPHASMSGGFPQQPQAAMSGGFPQQGAPHASMSGGFPQQPQAMMSGGYGAVPPHFSVPGAPMSEARMDPPGTAVSLSRAAPKPARGWVLAFAAVSAAAAIAAFGLTRGAPTAQATTAAFVDPSHAPGQGAPPATPATPDPAAQPAQPAGQAAAGQPVAAAGGQPVAPVSPADLLTQPVAQPAAVAPVASAAPVAAAPTPEPAQPQPAQAAVAAKPVAAAPVAAAPAPAPVAKAEPKPAAGPKPVAAAPAEPKETAPKPVAAAKPAKPGKNGASDDKKPAPSAADKEMKDAADALARAQLEQSL